MTMPADYRIYRRAGACWIVSEPAHIHPMWSHPDPLAAVVVMIARAVDMNGNDITERVAETIREALTEASEIDSTAGLAVNRATS